MNWKNSIIMLLTLGSISVGSGQNLTVSLITSDTSVTAVPARLVNDTALLKNIPFKGYHNWSLRKMAYYNLQAIYENVPDSSPTRKKSFKDFVERYQLDTSYLTKTRLPQNYIYLCTALDENGKKHLMFDADNNHDFSNDRELIFDLNDKKHSLPIINANISYYDGRVTRQAEVTLQIDVYHAFFQDNFYKSDFEKKLDVTINILQKNKTGTAVIDNQPFKVNILNYDKLHPKSPFKVNVTKLPFSEKNNNDYIYKNSDTIEIAGNNYKVLLTPTGDSLVLNFIGRSKNHGAETGTIAPDISSVDIQTNLPFSLRGQKGKYVIIDFWGSWCAPCIRLIPEVKSLYQKYKGQIQFVSIAYDKPGDLSKLQKLIKDNQMNWVQLTDNKNLKNGVIDQFKVDEFPTCLLIDKSGKVIYRGVSNTGLKDLIAYYENATTHN
jgi:thiol-disulfide isomerase/thioredoxin